MAKNWKELDKKNWRVDVGTPLKIAINAAEKTRLHVTSENQLVMNGEVIGTGNFASFASGDAVFTLTAANNGSEIVNALKLTYPDGRETTTAEDLKEALDYCHQCGMYLVDRSTNARVYVDYGSTGSYYGLWEAGATYVMDVSKMGYPTKMRFLTLKFDETNKRFSVLSGLELFQELSSVKESVANVNSQNNEQDEKITNIQNSLKKKAETLVILDTDLTTGSSGKSTFANIARVITQGGVVKVKKSQAQTSGNDYVDISKSATARYTDDNNFRYRFSYDGNVYTGNQSNSYKEKDINRIDTISDAADKAFSAVARDMISFGDDSGLAFRFTRNNGEEVDSSIIPVAGKTAGEPGLMRATDKEKLDTYPSNYSASVELLIAGKVDKENGKGLSSNDYTSEEKKALQLLDKYGFIGTFSSWNRLSGLTTDATSEQILTALQLKRIGGNVITDPSEANDIFNSCAVFGKYIQDNSTRSKVQIEYVSNYFVMTEMYSQPYKKDDDTYSYRPILRTVSLTYSSIKGFAIRDVARDFPLYDVVGLAAIKAAVPNKIECFTLNSSYLPTEDSGSNFAVYLNAYAKMARIAAAGGNVRVDAGTGTYGHTYVNLLDSLIVRYVSDISFRMTFEYRGKEYFFANDNGTLRNNITNITTTSERIAALEARVAALENK